MNSRDDQAPIYVFDGVCILCNGFVRFLIRRESAPTLRFAAMQSPIGRELMIRAGLSPDDPDSVILIEGGTTHYRGRAVLRALRSLRAPWRWLALGANLPAAIIDPLYLLIARNRYRVFGRHSVCSVDTSVRQRLLE